MYYRQSVDEGNLSKLRKRVFVSDCRRRAARRAPAHTLVVSHLLSVIVNAWAGIMRCQPQSIASLEGAFN